MGSGSDGLGPGIVDNFDRRELPPRGLQVRLRVVPSPHDLVGRNIVTTLEGALRDPVDVDLVAFRPDEHGLYGVAQRVPLPHDGGSGFPGVGAFEPEALPGSQVRANRLGDDCSTR